MSSKINEVVIAVAMVFARLVWVEKNNKRADYGDANAIRNSLAENGWLAQNPVCGVQDQGSFGHLTESQLRNEMEKRQKEWDALKTAVSTQDTPVNQANLHVFLELYTEKDENGVPKLVVPDVSMNAGFRRARNYFQSQCQRYTNVKDGAQNDIKTIIPVSIKFYNTEVERLIDQQLENEIQGVGTKKMEGLEKLAVTKSLFDEGCLEVELRRLYSSSIGQKTFGICQANVNWTNLGIYDRFFLPPDDTTGRRIPWGPVLAPDLIKINNRFEAQRKRSKGLPLTDDQRAMAPITEGEVDTYFVDKARNAGDGNASKIMKKTDMESKAKNPKIKLVGEAYDSVLGNTEANLKPFMDHASSLNGVYDLIQTGKGDFADSIIITATTHENLMGNVMKVIAAGKTGDLEKAIQSILFPAPATETASESVASVEVVSPPTPAPAVVETAPAVVETTTRQEKKNRQHATSAK